MDPASPYKPGALIESRFVGEDFVPDANLEKAAWQHAAWERFAAEMTGRRSFPEAETAVGSRWSREYLYVAFRCQYSTLNVFEGEDVARERWELWERDVVEVFVNPQPTRLNHYFEFEVAPNNQWIDLEIDKSQTPFNDASWNSGFKHAARVDAANRVWTCEMRIPVEALGMPGITAGDEWRVNFFRADGPGGGAGRRLMAWSSIPEGKTFHVPERFGVIRFVK
jgi:Carbohydrate family 9 binding domain-like